MMLDVLRANLKDGEGLRLKPYRCTAGKLSIGYGRNLDDVGITRAEAEMLLDADIERAASDLDRNAPWWRSLSALRQAALCEMCFNLGWPRLAGFKKLLAALERGEYTAAAAECRNSKWATQVGRRAERIAEMFWKG